MIIGFANIAVFPQQSNKRKTEERNQATAEIKKVMSNWQCGEVTIADFRDGHSLEITRSDGSTKVIVKYYANLYNIFENADPGISGYEAKCKKNIKVIVNKQIDDPCRKKEYPGFRRACFDDNGDPVLQRDLQ
jgi:hypothetical protein